MMLLLFIFIFLVGGVASTYWACWLLKPYLKSKEGRKLVFKGFVVLVVLSGGAYAVARYLMSEPTYFEQGIAQLHTSKYIEDRIEGFNSYTFDESKLLKEPRSPAVFHVEILGDSLNLYLTCTMTKVKTKWHLTKIKEDSTSSKH